MDKETIRKTMLQKRSTLQDKKKFDQKILNHVLDFAKDFKTIAIYHSFEDEINTHPIIEELLKLEKVVACPKILNRKMNFYPVKSLDDFKKGYFNIMEPISDTIIEPEDFDLILVPLLSYNTKLYRVGYGGGFYDRFLKKTKGLKMGLSYSFQFIDVDFEENYDVSLDGLITEENVVQL